MPIASPVAPTTAFAVPFIAAFVPASITSGTSFPCIVASTVSPATSPPIADVAFIIPVIKLFIEMKEQAICDVYNVPIGYLFESHDIAKEKKKHCHGCHPRGIAAAVGG